MQITNLRHQFNIHGAKIALLVLFLCTCFVASAQRRTTQNNPNYDNRFLSYGFLIGIHTSSYQLKYSDRFVNDLDSVYAISPKWSGGFTLGFIVNLKIAEYLDIRLLPQVSFLLEYEFLDAPKIEELVETTVVEFPVMAKYKSARRGNTRMYMIGGIKPGLEASGKNDIDEVSEDNIDINTFNLSVDIGFGFDFYYPLFKFSPEIRFSKGITNMLGSKDNPFGQGIDRLNTNTITIYFLFQ